MFNFRKKAPNQDEADLPKGPQQPTTLDEAQQNRLANAIFEIVYGVKEPHFNATLGELQMIREEDIEVFSSADVHIRLRVMCGGCSLPNELKAQVRADVSTVAHLGKVSVELFYDPEYQLPKEIAETFFPWG